MKLSIAILAKNEQFMIGGALESARWADEIVVGIDSTSTDMTQALATKSGAKVITIDTAKGFSVAKNKLIDACSGDWVFILDADERISKSLAQAIRTALEGDYDAYTMPWQNYYYGHKMVYCDSQEIHTRLFLHEAARYEGDIHEQLVFRVSTPKTGFINLPVAHFSHRSVMDNLPKTMQYANIQAHEMLQTGHPPVTRRTLVGVMLREFYKLAIKQRIYRDGAPGVIEMLYRPLSWFVVYARLWELQQKPSIDQQYKDWERVRND